jgi:hypothetical protein
MDAAPILRAAEASGEMVRIGRHRLEPRTAYSEGFVVGVSGELVMLHALSDRLDLDGYEIVRLRDITECTADFERRGVYEAALRLKGCHPRPVAGIRLDGIEAAIESVDSLFPVIVLHRERVAPHEVAIGRVAATQRSGVRLRWLSPSAEWCDDATLYRYASITRIGFAGEYETTLARLAAASPHPDDRVRPRVAVTPWEAHAVPVSERMRGVRHGA